MLSREDVVYLVGLGLLPPDVVPVDRKARKLVVSTSFLGPPVPDKKPCVLGRGWGGGGVGRGWGGEGGGGGRVVSVWLCMCGVRGAGCGV